NDDIGPGRVSITGWNLFRAKGTLADSSLLDHEMISNGALSYGIRLGESAVLEPNVEGRAWMQPGSSTSYMGTFGLRLQFAAGAFTIVPSGGYSYGQLAATDPLAGTNTTATLTGFHGTLAIRLR